MCSRPSGRGFLRNIATGSNPNGRLPEQKSHTPQLNTHAQGRDEQQQHNYYGYETRGRGQYRRFSRGTYSNEVPKKIQLPSNSQFPAVPIQPSPFYYENGFNNNEGEMEKDELGPPTRIIFPDGITKPVDKSAYGYHCDLDELLDGAAEDSSSEEEKPPTATEVKNKLRRQRIEGALELPARQDLRTTLKHLTRISAFHSLADFHLTLVARERLNKGVDEKFVKNVEPMSREELTCGRPCALFVPTSSAGHQSLLAGVWSRGVIESVRLPKVRIRLVDSGQILEELFPKSGTSEKLKPMPKQSARTPPLAYPCAMDDRLQEVVQSSLSAAASDVFQTGLEFHAQLSPESKYDRWMVSEFSPSKSWFNGDLRRFCAKGSLPKKPAVDQQNSGETTWDLLAKEKIAKDGTEYWDGPPRVQKGSMLNRFLEGLDQGEPIDEL